MVDHGPRQDAAGRRLRWPVGVALFLVATGAFTVFLLASGSRGSEIAGTLSLTVAILTAVPSVLSFWRESRLAERSEPARDRSGKTKLVSIVVAAAVGVGAAFAFWVLGGKADINVTSDVALSRSEGLRDGDEVTVTIPDRLSPPQRRYLAIAITILNPADTGSCVDPAHLDVRLSVDGQPPKTVVDTIGSGDEVTVDLDAVTRSAAIAVTLREQDPACRVNLRVDRAVLYN